MSETCSNCGGAGYTLSGDKREVCRCALIQKARAYLKPLGEKFIEIKNERILGLTGADNYLIEFTKETPILEIRSVMAHLLLKKGMKRTFINVNAYDLVSTFFEEHSQYWKLSQISADVILVDIGFNEPNNKLMPEFINYILWQQIRKRKLYWIFSKGAYPYKNTEVLCSENGFIRLEKVTI